MNKWMFSILGSNEDVLDDNGEILEIVPVTSLTQSDLTGFSVECLGAFPFLEDEGETMNYLGGWQERYKKLRDKFELKLYPVAFPEEETDTDTFFNKETIGKAYNWVQFADDYNLKPTGISTGYVLSLNVLEFKVTHDNGKKYITLQLGKRSC